MWPKCFMFFKKVDEDELLRDLFDLRLAKDTMLFLVAFVVRDLRNDLDWLLLDLEPGLETLPC